MMKEGEGEAERSFGKALGFDCVVACAKGGEGRIKGRGPCRRRKRNKKERNYAEEQDEQYCFGVANLFAHSLHSSFNFIRILSINKMRRRPLFSAFSLLIPTYLKKQNLPPFQPSTLPPSLPPPLQHLPQARGLEILNRQERPLLLHLRLRTRGQHRYCWYPCSYRRR